MKWLFWLLRKMLFIPNPRITREQALEIAHRQAETKGWKFDNPRAVEELREWRICTNGKYRPSPWVLICNQTGEVVRSRRPPR